MKSPARTISANFRRDSLMRVIFLGLAGGLAYFASNFLVRNDMTGLAYLGMAFVGFMVILAILNNWRNGVYLFLAWLLFEDFVRKFLGNNMAIYFAKDVLLAIAYLSFFLAYRRKELQAFRIPFRIPLLLFIWFGIMQIFNPASTHLVYGVLGAKLFFYYVPLLFIGYSLVDSEVELRKFFHINLALATIIASLGIAQAILGHTFLNPTNMAEEIRALSTNYRMAPISGAIVYRPNSVFVSSGRYGNFLLVIWLLGFGFMGYLLLRRKQGRTFAFLILAIAFGAIMLGASRGIFLWSSGSAIAGSIAFLWGAPWRQKEVLLVLRSLQRAVLGIALAIVLLLATFPEALLSRVAFYQETLSPSSSASELQHRTWDYPMQNFMGAFNYDRWPYGYGIGTTSLGVQYVSSIFQTKPPVIGVESGFGTLIVEMGVVGLTLWIIMGFSIVYCAWQIVKKLRGSPLFPIGFVIFWYAGLLFFPITFMGLQAYEDFVLNAYVWLLLGILFRLPSIALSSQPAVICSVLRQPSPRVS
jgi:hypothetical protein